MIKIGTFAMTAIFMFGLNYYRYDSIFLNKTQIAILVLVGFGWFLFGHKKE